MDEDVYERFQVSDWDLQNEFNPNRGRRHSKHSAIYGELLAWSNVIVSQLTNVIYAGIFGESDDEEDNRSYKSKSKSSGPVSFVSGGITGQNKPEADDDDEVVEAKPSTSGYQAGKKRRYDDFAGVKNTPDPNMGKWEKYTKGIGSKLLMKMGYEPGKGLGKNAHGITVPIEAKKREGAGAIGFYGAEHKQKAVFPEDRVKEEQKKQETKSKDGQKQVKDSKGRVRKTYVYKTVDEVLAEDLGGVASISSRDIVSTTKVIDMRGPEQKVLGGYHEICKDRIKLPREDLTPEQRELHEIEQNLQMLVDLTEQEMIRKNRNIKRETERMRYLDDEREYIKEKIAAEKKNIAVIESAIDSILQMKLQFESGSLTSHKLLDFINDFMQQFPSEHGLINLGELVESMGLPIIQREIANWDVMAHPAYCISTFMLWRRTLSKIDDKRYDVLVWEAWLLKVRQAIMQMTSMKQCDQLIRLLELWRPHLPEWLFYHITNQIVLPRLETEVQDWNPLTDPVPIHSWIHPWLPLFSDNSLDIVYAPIRQKLTAALAMWHPSDASAKVILSPWQPVFSAATWDAFLAVTIVPKLEAAMQQFVVNPQNQQGLEVWGWIMSWEGMITTPVLASIFEKHFFPKWLQALYHWLLHPVHNFDEIGNWYTGWKGMLSPEIAAQPVIKDFLRRALEMMDYAVSSPDGIASYRPGPQVSQQKLAEQIKFRQEILNSATTPSASSLNNFKQLVTKKAEENGVLFMPVQNKMHEGKQVYQFGKLRVYIDRSVVFVHNAAKNTWNPVSLQSLVDMA